MNARHNRIARGMACLVLTGALLLLLAPAALRAQSFEYHYGGNCWEGGAGGVQPVSTGGYISVGISASPSGCNNSDIYVVKSNNNGTLAWSRTYSIGIADSAWDIRECSNGDFIIVGTTDTNKTCGRKNDIFLLRISSTGAVLWAKTYGDASLSEYGRCVIQTTRAAGGFTAVGDFVVAGWRVDAAGMARAYLFRTTSNGAMIWDGAYTDTNAWMSRFYSVVESTLGTGAGDVVAAGMIDKPNSNAYMVRVNGGTGAFSGPTHGTLIVGGDSLEVLRTVQELTVGAEAGNLAAIGKCTLPGSTYGDIYIVKTGANPSAGPLLQHLYHASLCVGDEGIWLREITSTNPGFTTGNLICAGNNVIQTGSSAFLLEVVASNLAVAPWPANVGFQRYGLPAFNWSMGYSVAVVPAGAGRTPGFILAGTSNNTAPDPSQLYLVKTGTTGVSCSNTDTPVEDSVATFPWSTPNPQQNTILSFCGTNVPLAAPNWSAGLCFTPSAHRVDNPDDGRGSVSSVDDGEGKHGDAASLYPNPVRRGSMLTIDYPVTGNGELTVTVSDLLGRVIRSAKQVYRAGEARIPVSTEGWALGNYIVEVKAGDATVVRKIVVTDK